MLHVFTNLLTAFRQSENSLINAPEQRVFSLQQGRPSYFYNLLVSLWSKMGRNWRQIPETKNQYMYCLCIKFRLGQWPYSN
jgi:hypothetical protein